MEIIYKKIDEIVPYENNPRLNDGAVEAVANSIKEFGFKNPIILDKNNVIVAGHTRLKAAKRLGLEEAPCIYADDLTDEQVRAFRIADNKIAEYSDWDYGKLQSELDEINEEIDTSLFGFPKEKETESKGMIEYTLVVTAEEAEILRRVFQKIEEEGMNPESEIVKRVAGHYGY